MASRNYLLPGLLFSILLCVGSAHRLLSEPRPLLTTTTTEPPTAYAESHHPSYPPMRRQSHLHSRQPAYPPSDAYQESHHPSYPPSDAYQESHHPSYPPMRRQNSGYALGTRPFPLTPPAPPPSPSTEPPTPPRSAASGDDEWTWTTYKARAPLAGVNSGTDRTIPVIWPDLGGEASQDPFASELNYAYEEPPPRENNNN